MDVFLLVNLYISAFGLLSFSFLFFLQLKGWRDYPLPETLNATALTVVSLLWFLMGVLTVFPVVRTHLNFFSGMSSTLGMLFPPLINTAFYFSCRPNRAPRWFALGGLGLSVLISVVGLSIIFLEIQDGRPGGIRVGVSFQIAFLWVAAYSATLIYGKRQPMRDLTEVRYRKRLYQLMILLTLMTFSFYFPILRELGGVLARSMPLVFVLSGLYYRQKYEFFDLAVKRGLFLFSVFGLVLIYFAAVLPLAEGLGGAGDRTLILTLLALPGALALPWFYRRLERWLDRIWLGRRYSPVDAAGLFLSEVREATSEQELLRLSGKSLCEIFQAQAEVVLGVEPSMQTTPPRTTHWKTPPQGALLEIPLQFEGDVQGVIRMGERPNRTPYFKSDRKLLSTLAGILARLLEHVRLQERHRQQERRQEELRLHASQSELKALRAQINPHFLFNALNAIAGLIHKHPRQAEETVERLAEVFRYTLSRSEEEWVRLESEMEFIGAYLEVERARFGKRLETSVEIDTKTRELWIPCMLVQTLVENAVKHGVSSVRGVASIRIRARLRADRLIIEVSDNGPGFEASSRNRPGTGFGLSSIRRRLEGYFGDRARLTSRREQGRTVIQIEMPARLGSLSELGKEPQDRRENQAHQQAADDGDVEAKAGTFDADVAGEPTQPRDGRQGVEKDSEQQQDQPCNHQAAR